MSTTELLQETETLLEYIVTQVVMNNEKGDKNHNHNVGTWKIESLNNKQNIKEQTNTEWETVTHEKVKIGQDSKHIEP